MRLGASLFLCLAACEASAQQTLQGYAVDPKTVTVSGISSGGFMAVQFQVAYASRFHGAAIIAGGPYACAQGVLSTAEGACESGTGLSVPTLIAYTDAQSDAGTIDSPSALAGKPVYLFSGTKDTTVHPAVMDALQQYLEHYVAASEVTYDNTVAAAHGWISPDGPNQCDLSYVPYINNCNVDVEDTFLTLFYGTLQPKTTGTLGGSFIQFNQDEFCDGGSCSAISMDSTGWVFVPQSCAAGAPCKLVIALHGCLMYQGVIQEQFVQKSGLDEWADTNGIVVLYPQATTSGSTNPDGCWDWWGYTGADYALRTAPQMSAVMAMVDRITSGPHAVSPDGGSAGDAGHGGSSPDAGKEDGGRSLDGGAGEAPHGGCGCSARGSPFGVALPLAAALAFAAGRRKRRTAS